MALIDARKRMDVTGQDIGEQPDSKYILMYNELPFAIDDYAVNPQGTLSAWLRGQTPVVSFNARRATWLVIKRSVAKLATKEEIASAQADLQKLGEEMFAKFHPDEYKAYLKQRAQQLGLATGDRDPGNYL
jgi:hypothetical protein